MSTAGRLTATTATTAALGTAIATAINSNPPSSHQHVLHDGMLGSALGLPRSMLCLEQCPTEAPPSAPDPSVLHTISSLHAMVAFSLPHQNPGLAFVTVPPMFFVFLSPGAQGVIECTQENLRKQRVHCTAGVHPENGRT